MYKIHINTWAKVSFSVMIRFPNGTAIFLCFFSFSLLTLAMQWIWLEGKDPCSFGSDVTHIVFSTKAQVILCCCRPSSTESTHCVRPLHFSANVSTHWQTKQIYPYIFRISNSRIIYLFALDLSRTIWVVDRLFFHCSGLLQFDLFVYLVCFASYGWHVERIAHKRAAQQQQNIIIKTNIMYERSRLGTEYRAISLREKWVMKGGKKSKTPFKIWMWKWKTTKNGGKAGRKRAKNF